MSAGRNPKPRRFVNETDTSPVPVQSMAASDCGMHTGRNDHRPTVFSLQNVITKFPDKTAWKYYCTVW